MSAYEPPRDYEPPDTELSPADRQRVQALLVDRAGHSPFASDPEEIRDPNVEMAFRETSIAQADIDADARTIAERIYDRMAERIPGWVAHDSELATILIDEFSTVAAEIRQEALNVPEAIFITYAEEVLGIPIEPPAPALGRATFTAQDEQGYTVGAALQFTLARSGDELVVFSVLSGAVIPPGERSVSGVQIVAAEAGANGNGLSGAGDPVDPLMWVESIEVETPTTSGTNGQTNDEFVSALVSLLRMIALRPILPWDFARLALRVAGVGRAIAMDGYRPTDDTWGHARTVTLILTDEYGEPCSTPIRETVRDMLEALREVNWLVYVVDGQYVPVSVSYQVTAFAEQNPDVVRELCDDAIYDALLPANFRLGTTSPAIAAGEVIPPPSATGEQPGRQTLRINDFVALLDRTRGVDFVNHESVLINGERADYVLPGPTVLPRPGTIEGTVHTQ